MTTYLTDLKIGESARIVSFNPGNNDYRRKLLAMGLTPNATLTVIRRAPFGDPIEVQVHDAHISLRQAEAYLLKLSKVNS